MCKAGTNLRAGTSKGAIHRFARLHVDNCAAETLSCSACDVLTEDLTTGNYSEPIGTSSQGQTFNWAFAGALEVYNVAQCSNYPAGGSFAFYDLELYNDSFVLYSNPGWSFTNASSGLTPQCGYGASVAGEGDALLLIAFMQRPGREGS